MRKKEEFINVIIAQYLSGESNEAVVNLLARWVSEDANNLEYFLQMKNLWELSNPAFDTHAIDERAARSQIKKRISKKNSFVYYFQRVAAILFIPITLYALYSYFSQETQSSLDQIYQEVVAPYGTYSSIQLADGSKVWLNSGSKLKYPVKFDKLFRNVYLDGEAYFEVHSDQSHPFIVHAGLMNVKATGTKFSVDAFPSDSVCAVTMASGIVDVCFNSSKPVEVFPNQRILYNKHTSKYSAVETQPYKWFAWKDGIMMFRDDSLDYVFKQLDRTFNVDIVIMNPEIAKYKYRATFNRESIREILDLLKISAPIDYKIYSRDKREDGSYSKQRIEVFSLEVK